MSPNEMVPEQVDMPSLLAYNDGMAKNTSGRQLTVRGVPEEVAKKLKKRAAEEGKSLNRVLVEALSLSAGMTGDSMRVHDLDWIAGTWVEDPEFDAALAAQDTVDEELWR